MRACVRDCLAHPMSYGCARRRARAQAQPQSDFTPQFDAVWAATVAPILAAAASPIQFCLFPDQYMRVLLSREVFSNNTLGPVFWANGAVPSGYGPTSATNHIRVLGDMPAYVQQDFATLAHTDKLPCSTNGTLKCEACVNNCQNWTSVPVVDVRVDGACGCACGVRFQRLFLPLPFCCVSVWVFGIQLIANERTHFTVPGTADVDVLLYRSHSKALWASSRPAPNAAWTAPALTNIPDDDSNMCVGVSVPASISVPVSV